MALSSLRSFLMLAVGDAVLWHDTTRGKAPLAKVSYPEKSQRRLALLPASVDSRSAFLRKCVGCLKCLQACPRKVLRVSDSSGHYLRPEMDFRYGWCFPECSLCAQACPTGALGAPLTAEAKKTKKTGVAVWDRPKCLLSRGEKCQACQRQCPVNAITQSTDGVIVVDAKKCIGCGACENHCPARPAVAIHVEGLK